MRKIHLRSKEEITFREGCERYLDDCRARNLREGTIGHYRQSYTQFYKYFDPDMLISELSEKKYNQYVIFLRETLKRDEDSELRLADFQKLCDNKLTYGEIKQWFLNTYPIFKECRTRAEWVLAA